MSSLTKEKKEHRRLLAELGYVRDRQNEHEVWIHPEYQTLLKHKRDKGRLNELELPPNRRIHSTGSPYGAECPLPTGQKGNGSKHTLEANIKRAQYVQSLVEDHKRRDPAVETICQIGYNRQEICSPDLDRSPNPTRSFSQKRGKQSHSSYRAY